MSHGFTVYENLVESDYWWWYVAVDMGDALLSDGETLYQWVTLVDQTAENPDDPFTIGCRTTKGTDDTYNIDVYTHTEATAENMYNDSNEVVGQTWATQDADEIEDASDIDWVSGTDHITTLAPESETFGNTNFACYFAKELPKIGRNPADFNKDYSVIIGARLYESDSATTFDAIPASEDSFTLPEPESYLTEAVATGASSLLTSALAGVFMLVAMSF